MADNSSLGAAKSAKNDEFYTQYSDIEAEMNAYVEYDKDVFRDKVILLPCDDPEWSNFTRYFAANFETFGLKKLISTSYAKGAANRQLSLFEQESPLYDEAKHETRGKLFVLERDVDGSGNIDSDDIEFTGYLEGDGDFRSAEVTALRDEADIIITNPPFSLFREFLAWIMAGEKQFIIIGNQNVITYKEVFPLLKSNRVWLGAPFPSGNAYFDIPDDADTSVYAKGVFDPVTRRLHFRNCRWFTNVDFGGRHDELSLTTMARNLKFNKKLVKKLNRDYGISKYPKYDNYDAIEVPFTECIPSDYEPGYLVPVEYKQQLLDAGFVLGSERVNSENVPCVCVCVDKLSLQRILPLNETEFCNGVMGVPITFLDKYNPAQFEILGIANSARWIGWECYTVISGKKIYNRILVRPTLPSGATV